ncbi:hypothetical protein SCLARK_00128 [Spiroplasma clarkii]|nr:hypothetical protein SCLARK_00128 [Spiroplasma clarkii]
MFPSLSVLYSTLPDLISSTAFLTLTVTVPVFGLGIKPFGPSTLPIFPSSAIISGVATITSYSNQFSFEIFWINSSPPTKSAPASSASLTLVFVKTKTFWVFPVPPGNTSAPLICWSACLGSTFRLNATSTVASNFVIEVSFANLIASAIGYNFVLSTLALTAFNFYQFLP